MFSAELEAAKRTLLALAASPSTPSFKLNPIPVTHTRQWLDLARMTVIATRYGKSNLHFRSRLLCSTIG